MRYAYSDFEVTNRVVLVHETDNYTTKLIYIVLNPAHVPVCRIKTGRTLGSRALYKRCEEISQRRGSLEVQVQRPYLKYSVKRVCTLVLLYAACRRRMNPHRIRSEVFGVCLLNHFGQRV
jgi:hypothetical protein